mmetsp:Transcript_13622/g.29244  ORF Transcript_13622/g.29244 Transcript_13622/m.29244 type:complete len:470 (-) Transcript_13622:99-1508(-)
MTNKDSTTTTNPIIIVGAGPAGLLAALVLEQHGSVPFVLIERAALSKVCSNTGSGFDLASTAMSIMKDRLGLPIEDAFPRYDRMHIATLDGNGGTIRTAPSVGMYGASRSTMQHFFLQALLGEKWKEIQNDDGDEKKRNTTAERTLSGMGELRCGVGVSGYEETDEHVTVQLEDGTEIVGAALLGCDGIHSSVRRHMISQVTEEGEDDQYNFCNISCWWGKTEVTKDDEVLQKLVNETQTDSATGARKPSIAMMLGTRKVPGSFYMIPTEHENVYNWALCMSARDPPTKSSDDLTRRGGFVLDDADKKQLQQMARGFCPLVRQLIQETPSDKMTNVGLFDRKNLDLPYSTDKRVALLGDAAHPQSPFMGQGCNMALVDAYVLATRLCRQSTVSEVLRAYDSTSRRASVNEVIRFSRQFGNYSVSNHWFTCWAMRMSVKYMPASRLTADDGDRSNHDFVKELHDDLGIVG